MMIKSSALSFEERSVAAHHPLAKELFQLMCRKQTNIALAADVNSCLELLEIADELGPEIAVLKTHVDILDDFDPLFPEKLSALARQHRFLIFEDRKFADIGSTASRQYEGGIYKISSWSHLTNAHILSGPGIIQGLKKVGLPLQRGLLLLAQMSSEGNLLGEEFCSKAIEMAKVHRDFVMGFICQKQITNEPGFIHFTPGISLEKERDGLGQRYRSPEVAIGDGGSDIAIIGRGILESKNPHHTAKQYRIECWNSYQKRL